MQLNTKHFGIMDIDEKGIINFPEGIPGFEDVRKFVILGTIEENNPFQWLQSVDKPQLAFVIIDPKFIKPDYCVDVEDADVEVLGIKDMNNVQVYSIVVIPEDVTKMTANLKAPVIVNLADKKGKQVIAENKEYQVKHYILEELQKR